MPNNTTQKLGDWNAICDECGFKFKASELRKRWDGYMVCPKDWEVRHPQDFLKGRKDDQTVAWTRPEQEDDFVDSFFILDENSIKILDSLECGISDREQAYAVPSL